MVKGYYLWYQQPALYSHKHGNFYFLFIFTKVKVINIYLIQLQFSSLKTKTMKSFEPALYEDMEKRTKGQVPDRIYFNKGL